MQIYNRAFCALELTVRKRDVFKNSSFKNWVKSGACYCLSCLFNTLEYFDIHRRIVRAFSFWLLSYDLAQVQQKQTKCSKGPHLLSNCILLHDMAEIDFKVGKLHVWICLKPIKARWRWSNLSLPRRFSLHKEIPGMIQPMNALWISFKILIRELDSRNCVFKSVYCAKTETSRGWVRQGNQRYAAGI